MPAGKGRGSGRRESGELPAGDPVRARIEARRGDPGVRWHMSKHTLELAIGALEGAAPAERGTSSKARRRRRKKRFL